MIKLPLPSTLTVPLKKHSLAPLLAMMVLFSVKLGYGATSFSIMSE